MYDCPQILEACLLAISYEYERVTWNATQKEVVSPFDNTGGETYDNKVFSVHSYSWTDDDQPYNFKYKDIEVRWYKYLGRGMRLNREVTLEEIEELLINCLESLEEKD